MELPLYSIIVKIQVELAKLDEQLVKVDGGYLKPSQCYRYEISPHHLMFNTNCPESLRKRINAILNKYLHADESSAQ